MIKKEKYMDRNICPNTEQRRFEIKGTLGIHSLRLDEEMTLPDPQEKGRLPTKSLRLRTKHLERLSPKQKQRESESKINLRSASQ